MVSPEEFACYTVGAKFGKEEQMPYPLFHVDAFTLKAFAGNPAAVCILDQPREEAWMQNVACEMNLSETAFLVKRDDGFDLP